MVSNPEFLKEGAAIDDFMKPDRVVIGTDNVRTAEIMKELYDPFMRKQNRMIVMDIRSAEMTKYAANAMLATRISFMNQIAGLCERMGADVAAVREGIGSDSRIGYDFLFPGPGYGGSCFPKDVKALVRTAEECDYDFLLLKAVEEVNERQKEVLADKLIKALGSPDEETSADRAHDRLLGPLLQAPHRRHARGPGHHHHRTAAGCRRHRPGPRPRGDQGGPQGLRRPHRIQPQPVRHPGRVPMPWPIITDWSEYRNPDFDRIKAALKSPLVVDGRNLYKPDRMAYAGFTYIPLGRCGGSSCEVK